MYKLWVILSVLFLHFWISSFWEAFCEKLFIVCDVRHVLSLKYGVRHHILLIGHPQFKSNRFDSYDRLTFLPWQDWYRLSFQLRLEGHIIKQQELSSSSCVPEDKVIYDKLHGQCPGSSRRGGLQDRRQGFYCFAMVNGERPYCWQMTWCMNVLQGRSCLSLPGMGLYLFPEKTASIKKTESRWGWIYVSRYR